MLLLDTGLCEKMTCIELKRAIEAGEEKQMCARGKLPLALPEPVTELFHEACRAVEVAERRFVPTAEALDENLRSTCLAHHLHGIHKGYVRLRGRAPDELVWELGEVD
jgi:hypothetical protein